MEFNNFWQNFLLSCIYKKGEMEKEAENIIAYRDDDGDLIILSKINRTFDIRGWNSKTRDFFDLKDIEMAYKLLIKTEATEVKIIKPDVWEEFKRAVVLNELMK